MALRRGEAEPLFDLLPLLASINAFAIWLYALHGERMLFYQSAESYKDIIDRFGGMLYNPNNSAFFCALVILLSLVRIRRMSLPLQIFSVLNMLFLFATIFVLRSRTPLFLLAIGALLLGWRKGYRRWLLLLIAAGAFVFVRYGNYLDVSQSTKDPDLIERLQHSAASADTRELNLVDTLQGITEWPLGTGEVSGFLSNSDFAVAHLEPHNEYLGFVLRHGIAGGVTALILFMLIAAAWLGAVRYRYPYRPGAELCMMMFAFLFTLSVEPIYHNSRELAILFATIFGMFLAAVLCARPRLSSDVENSRAVSRAPDLPGSVLPGNSISL